jgi:inositol 1,4,5-triphosphate receptor type 1
MEEIVFPIPEVCEYLTEETRHRIYLAAERDEKGSKVTDFFERHEALLAEMRWQKKLHGTSPIDCFVCYCETSAWFFMKIVK